MPNEDDSRATPQRFVTNAAGNRTYEAVWSKGEYGIIFDSNIDTLKRYYSGQLLSESNTVLKYPLSCDNQPADNCVRMYEDYTAGNSLISRSNIEALVES